MPDRTTSIEAVDTVHELPRPERAQTTQELQDQLAERDEEILRLRDLLISRDAELGAARGRLAILEMGSQRLANATARIPIPGATRVLQGLIRLVQRAMR
jgi:hypothetical protein